MRTGLYSNEESAAVISGIRDDRSYADIAADLDRTVKSVKDHITFMRSKGLMAPHQAKRAVQEPTHAENVKLTRKDFAKRCRLHLAELAFVYGYERVTP